MNIDYSNLTPPSAARIDENWEPPPHKFFGKKLGNGKTEKEPVYVHREFPAFRYAMVDGKISAKLVNNVEELQALGAGWVDTPAKFGFIGAPSYEEHLGMMKEAESKAQEAQDDATRRLEAAFAEQVRRGPGRPPKQ